MKLGIIGAGSVGGTLGTAWAQKAARGCLKPTPCCGSTWRCSAASAAIGPSPGSNAEGEMP
jgi:hypothetical protein